MSLRKVLTLILFSLTQLLTAQEIRLGIVTDFDRSIQLDSMINVIINEINQTTSSSIQVVLPNGNAYFGNNEISSASTAHNLLLPKSDIIILIGSVSAKGALLNQPIQKPTFGIGVINPDIQNIPITPQGTSGVENFTYIWPRDDFEGELSKFKELLDFKSLALIVDSDAQNTFDIESAQNALNSLEQTYGTKINIVPFQEGTNNTLNLPDGTDAVYLSSLYSKTTEDIRLLANDLKIRKIPSFSVDRLHVDSGILASLSKRSLLDQTIRRISIMVDESISAISLSEMKVILEYDRELFLNIQTANEIDFSPSFENLFTANLIGENDLNLPTYSMMEVIQKALDNNFDIKISYQDIDLTEQDIRLARSSVLPIVDLSMSGSVLDKNFANNIQPERAASGQLSLSQVIYSEEAIAGIKVSQYLKNAQKYNTETLVLSVQLDAYFSYFNVLATKTNVTIRQENLDNSKTNLELAKFKVNLGSSGNGDLYRWEREVANAKQALVEAKTGLITSKYELNTFLANILEEEFKIEDVELDGAIYRMFRDNPIAEFIRTSRDFELLSDFLVTEAVNNNPNKKLLLENIKATERQRKQNQRLFYVPTIALQAQASRFLARGGIGSTETPGFSFNKNNWQAGISLSLPLFQGNARKANLQSTIIQLNQLNDSKDQLDQNLELSIKSGLLQILNSTSNISFSQVASDNSQLNFELVQENYKQGLVNITQLIDAQQAALQDKLTYTLSVYDFIQAQLQIESVLGFYSMFITPEEWTNFQDRFLQFRINR